MENRIKITYLLPSKNENSPIVATVGIQIISMDLYMSKIKLVKKKDGSFYFASPSEEYIDPSTGKTKYVDYFAFGKKASHFFQQECLKALESYCKFKNIKNPTHE